MKHIHDLEMIRETSNGILEVCKSCKKRIKTRKGFSDKINNKEYLKTHVADTAQPYGRTGKVFKKLYGEPDDFERERKGVVQSIKDQSQYNTDLQLEEIEREDVGSGKLIY